MTTPETPEPNGSTERLWLARGLKDGYIREETAEKIIQLLDSLDSE